MCLMFSSPLFHHLVFSCFRVSTIWHFSFHSTISVGAPNKVMSWWKRLLGMCLVSTAVHWWNVFGVAHLVFWCPLVVAAPNHLRHLYRPKQALDTPCFLATALYFWEIEYTLKYTLCHRPKKSTYWTHHVFFAPAKHTALTLYKLPDTTDWCGTHYMLYLMYEIESSVLHTMS